LIEKRVSNEGEREEGKVKRIIVSEMITLDGYFAGPNGELDWFFWNKEMEKSAIDLINTVDTLLFGRATYELMASYWPLALHLRKTQ
jgi:dihydrofolate reductase